MATRHILFIIASEIAWYHFVHFCFFDMQIFLELLLMSNMFAIKMIFQVDILELLKVF